MGSLTASWKLCSNMPGWVWKERSFLVSINPALTHVSSSEAAPEKRRPPAMQTPPNAAVYLHIRQLRSSSLTHLEAKVNSGARVFPSLITLEGNICLFSAAKRSVQQPAEPLFC